MQPRLRGDLVWATWLAGGAVSFTVLEAIAFRHEPYPTLSRTLAAWLGIDPAHRFGRPAQIAFALAWIGLTVHLHTQPRRPVV